MAIALLAGGCANDDGDALATEGDELSQCPRGAEAGALYEEAMQISSKYKGSFTVGRGWSSAPCSDGTPLDALELLLQANELCPGRDRRFRFDDSEEAVLLREITPFIERDFVTGLLPRFENGDRDWRNFDASLTQDRTFENVNWTLTFYPSGQFRIDETGIGVFHQGTGLRTMLMDGASGTPTISLQYQYPYTDERGTASLELNLEERGEGRLPFAHLVVTSSDIPGFEGEILTETSGRLMRPSQWYEYCGGREW